MRILALPARSNRSRNPYNAILSDRLEELGWRVEEGGIRKALMNDADIVHVHWPQAPAGAPFPAAIRRALSLLGLLAVQKLKGGRNVWTVHNVQSHEQLRPGFERLLMRAVVRLLDGYLVLNRHSRAEAIARYPRLARLPWALVPHFIYGSAYQRRSERADARRKIDIPDDLPVVGLVGELKGYKGLDRAMSAVLAVAPGAMRVLIAGSFKNPAEADRVREKIAIAQRAGHDVHLREGFMDNDELVATMSACDLLLLPYSSASNSGFAILAGELGIPMLLADTPVFRDLAEELGPPHSVAVDGFAAEEVLEAARTAKAVGPVAPSSLFMESRAQMRAANLTDAFYRSLAADPQSDVRRTPD